METTDETKVLIRKACKSDAEAIRDIHRDVISEKDYFIAVPEEFNITIEQTRERIDGVLNSERDTLLVAEVRDHVVGWLLFKSQAQQRLQHTGTFGVMVHKKYRGFGTGKKLILELLDWAGQNPLIEKVSLGVFSTNVRAIALYRRLGFIEEGRKIKEFKMDDDIYVDDVLMYKLVK